MSSPSPDTTIDEQRAIQQEVADEHRETEPEAAEPPAKKGRKSKADDEARKKPRTSDGGGGGNIRLERLREALEKFLDLIEFQVSSEKIAKSLPRMDGEVVEALRQQFVQQLKESIKEENEKLIQENQMDHKLASLHALALEADRRHAQGLKPGSEELKDVWRPDLDIETAISARAIPEQEERIAALKQELKEVQACNAKLHADLKAVTGKAEERQSEAKDALDALDQAIEALEATPDMQDKLRQTMDHLLADLGART